LSISETERDGCWAGGTSKMRMAIKTEFICKCISSITLYMQTNVLLTYLHIICISGLKSTNNLPAPQLLQLQRKDKTTLGSFCNNFLTCISGNHYWKQKNKIKTHLWTCHNLSWSICIACFTEYMGWIKGYECSGVFLKTQRNKKANKRRKMGENIG